MNLSGLHDALPGDRSEQGAHALGEKSNVAAEETRLPRGSASKKGVRGSHARDLSPADRSQGLPTDSDTQLAPPRLMMDLEHVEAVLSFQRHFFWQTVPSTLNL